jgi:hypothetical protein
MSEKSTIDKAEQAPSSQAVELAKDLANYLPPALFTNEQRQQFADAWAPIIEVQLLKAFSRGVEESREGC